MKFVAHLLGAWLMVFFTLAAMPSFAEEAKPAGANGNVSYHRDVRPIFQMHCQGCHQPSKAGGEYVTTRFDHLTKGGESGEAAVMPGKPEESALIAQITPKDGEAAMPKGKPPLSEAERNLIAAWIAQGAKDDSPAATGPMYDMDHPPTYPARPVVNALDFSPDGKLLAVGGYHEVLLHHADGSGIVARLVGLSERIESVSFSPDGTKLLVTGGSPGRLGEVQVWDVQKRALISSLSAAYDTCYGGSWSPDGKFIAFGSPDTSVRALEAESLKQVLFNGAHDDWVLDTVFSVNGSHLVSVSRDRSMKLYEVATNRFIDNISSITPGALKGGLHSVDRHPTKDELAIGGADGTPKIYRMFREKARQIGDDFNLIRAFEAMPGRVYDVRFSKNGELLAASSSLDGTGEVRVYNVADGKALSRASFADGGVFVLAIHPDNQTIASAGFAGKLRLTEAATGKLIREFEPAPLEVASK